MPKSLLAAAILMALLTEPAFANEEQELNLGYGRELAIGESTFDAVESTESYRDILLKKREHYSRVDFPPSTLDTSIPGGTLIEGSTTDQDLSGRLLKAQVLLQGDSPVADAKGLEADLRSEIERKKLIDSDTSIATDFLMLGQLYIQLNRFVEAEALLRNANAVATSSSQQNLAFQIQTNLGKAYAKQNKNTEAEIWLELAIETGLRTKDPELRQPVKALAELHVAKKEYDEAIVLWNFLIPPRSSNKPAPLGVLMAMAEIYETEKKLFEAEETLKEGVAASESWKAEALPEVLPETMPKTSLESATASAIPTANMMAEKAQILAKLGAFYHRQNKFPQAVANYQKAVDIAEKIPSLDAATLKTYTEGLNSVKRNEPAL